MELILQNLTVYITKQYAVSLLYCFHLFLFTLMPLNIHFRTFLSRVNFVSLKGYPIVNLAGELTHLAPVPSADMVKK